MDPITIAIITSAAGTGMQMKGQYEAGKAAERQAKDEAALDEYNAKLAEREATESKEAAAYEESKFRKGAERLKATQRARYAKAGITFEGSPLDVMAQTASELEMDALMIRRGGQLGYQRYTAESELYKYAGRSALLRGRSARRASQWGMAATGMKGGSELAFLSSLRGKKEKLSDTAKATFLRY